MTVGRAALAVIPICRESGPSVLVPHIADIVMFSVTLLDEDSGYVILRLEHTSHIE